MKLFYWLLSKEIHLGTKQLFFDAGYKMSKQVHEGHITEPLPEAGVPFPLLETFAKTEICFYESN